MRATVNKVDLWASIAVKSAAIGISLCLLSAHKICFFKVDCFIWILDYSSFEEIVNNLVLHPGATAIIAFAEIHPL